MRYEARFLNLRVFLSFPQSNFMFTASILTCATAFFARFHFFEKGCMLLCQSKVKSLPERFALEDYIPVIWLRKVCKFVRDR